MFPDLAEAAIWIVVQLRSAGPHRTEVRITQLGWGTLPLRDRAFTHMLAGWQMVPTQLEQRFESGPLDWEAVRRMWQERRPESRAGAHASWASCRGLANGMGVRSPASPMLWQNLFLP
jgi:hypothetical protein